MNFLQAVISEISHDWPDTQESARVIVRLLAALVLTALIGWEREVGNKTAGLRTHLLVALGSALFVFTTVQTIGENDAITRVIQGVAPGIGFIGAGAIIKEQRATKVRGLTTATSIWMAAAIGISCGLGHYFAAATAVLLTWVVLAVLESIKEKFEPKKSHRWHNDPPPG